VEATAPDNAADDLFEAMRSATPAPPAEQELPDFLTKTADAPEPVSNAEPDVPDWLNDSAPAEPVSPAMMDAPDWLKDSESAPTGAQPATETPAAMSDVPDWLTDNEPTLSDAQPAKTEEAAPTWLSETLPPPAAADTSAPDWLIAAAEAKPEELPVPASEQPLTPPPATPAPADAGVPDWLSNMASDDMPASPPPAPSAPPPADAGVPDWLSNMASDETPAAPPPVPSAPAPTDAGVPDWLSNMASDETPAAPPPAPTDAGVPDWLNDIASAETPVAPPATPSEGAIPLETAESALPVSETVSGLPGPTPAAPGATDDLLDWMSDPSVDLGSGAGSPAPSGIGEDLLGLTDDLAMSAGVVASDEGAAAAPAGELPEWLRGLKPTADGEARPITGPTQPSELSDEAMSEISDLRFDKIMGDAPRGEASGPEKVGALKDVSGAIRPELVFDAQRLTGGKLVGESILTKEQERRILLLEGLLARQKEEVPISRARRGVLPIDRWLVALLVIAAIVVPLALGIKVLSAPSAPSGGVSDAKKVLDSLSPDARVLVAFEYEPDTAAEMEPLAGALLKPLAGRADISVLAISTKPVGPVMADRVFRQVNPKLSTAVQPTNGITGRWINLGYLPGGSVGVSGIAVGSVYGSPFAYDYLGQSTEIEAKRLSDLPPDLIIVLATSGEDLRMWVEQAGRPTHIPMLGATSVSSTPMAVPYRQSQQLTALVSGVNDAIAYRALTGQTPDKPLEAVWNAQASGALAAVVLIIAGNIIYGLMAVREQQEQNA